MFYLIPLAHCPTCRRPLFFALSTESPVSRRVGRTLRVLTGVTGLAMIGMVLGMVRRAFSATR
jgi:hypothetical protein